LIPQGRQGIWGSEERWKLRGERTLDKKLERDGREFRERFVGFLYSQEKIPV